jgi:hypothetical protein
VALILVLLDTGARISEICRAKIADYNSVAGELTLQPYGTGCKSHGRVVFLGKRARQGPLEVSIAIEVSLVHNQSQRRQEGKMELQLAQCWGGFLVVMLVISFTIAARRWRWWPFRGVTSRTAFLTLCVVSVVSFLAGFTVSSIPSLDGCKVFDFPDCEAVTVIQQLICLAGSAPFAIAWCLLLARAMSHFWGSDVKHKAICIVVSVISSFIAGLIPPLIYPILGQMA